MTDSRYIITDYNKGILSCEINDNRLQNISVSYRNAGGCIGDIYVAKVLNVLNNLNAAFIYYQQGEKGYLPLNNGYTPILLNRKYDGRLIAGDEIIVQLDKEAIRTKEPVFTMNLSLSGRYCVITNANTRKSVSNKISKQYKEILLNEITQDTDYGVIIRTNAESLVRKEQLIILHNECEQLIKQKDNLLQNGIHRTCYSLLWHAPEEYLTELRDMHDLEYQSIITDNSEIYEQLKGLFQTYFPDKQSILTLYQDDSYSLSKLHGLETKVNELLGNKVWLKSGAYLVIEQTEAMYVIDVNSGKNITKKSNPEYILSINIEAAHEIIRQIILRNLSGIIIVDFINMDDNSMSDMLMQELRKLAKQDKILTTIVDMTPLGLVEITRKKTKRSFKEQLKSITGTTISK